MTISLKTKSRFYFYKNNKKFNKLDLSKIEKIRGYTKNSSTYLARFIFSNSKKNTIRLAKQYKKIAAFIDNLIKNNLIRNRIY